MTAIASLTVDQLVRLSGLSERHLRRLAAAGHLPRPSRGRYPLVPAITGLLRYQRLRNLVTLVMATAYFSAAWLGESLKLAVLVSRVKKLAKRFFGVPDFHYYALADGIRVLLSRLPAESRPRAPTPTTPASAQLLLFDST